MAGPVLAGSREDWVTAVAVEEEVGEAVVEAGAGGGPCAAVSTLAIAGAVEAVLIAEGGGQVLRAAPAPPLPRPTRATSRSQW